MSAILFEHDDEGYLGWVAEHPVGYVLNIRRRPSLSYAVLHRAKCRHISALGSALGAFTSRGYRKVCALYIDDLRAFVRSELHCSAGTFSSEGCTCLWQ